MKHIYQTLKKAIHCLRSEGLRTLVFKTLTYLTKKAKPSEQSNVSSALDRVVDSEEATFVQCVQYVQGIQKDEHCSLTQRFPYTREIQTFYVHESQLRLTVLMDTLDPNASPEKAALGLTFATYLAHRLNGSLRLITRDNTHVDTVYFLKLLKHHQVPAPAQYELLYFPHAEAYSAQRGLPVSKQDIFIATSWTQAFVARNISLRKGYLYLIHSDETRARLKEDERLFMQVLLDDPSLLPVFTSEQLYRDFLSRQSVYFRAHDLRANFDEAYPHILTHLQHNHLESQ